MLMQPSEALAVAAQVAVTLASFAGIVVVFRPRSVHEWPALDQFRLRLLLANSALPLVTSLFGMLLLTMVPPPVAIWRWCSGFALVVQLPFLISANRIRRNIAADDYQTVNALLFYVVAALGMVALVLQAINVAIWNRFWPFYASVFVHLLAAVAQFVRFVLLPPHEQK